ncbi:hypothetical protein D7B24_003259 [Verticillium nonalfalfae]|uniref:Uncharacterized protein n=1 Tax=Verticillium nonalfalfae TaxID=1051616 RepID=A0A3M9YHA3_9PEZI|nr:uncharacterized protein D7B24_003259 [Verticillium nonalfalfae]RNJ59166.1 hypothetical protein D7B24_003259 [Verticillium nonalfalfae]
MAPLGKIAILGIAALFIASSAVPLAGTTADDEVMDLYEQSAEVLNDNGRPAPVLKPRSASPGRGREQSRDGSPGRDQIWGRDRSREKSLDGGHGGGNGDYSRKRHQSNGGHKDNNESHSRDHN